MSKHSARRSRQQRRRLRLLAAFGITGGLLAVPAATVGATYVPDVLRLGPGVGHRFNDPDAAPSDEDDPWGIAPPDWYGPDGEIPDGFGPLNPLPEVIPPWAPGGEWGVPAKEPAPPWELG